MTNEKYVNIARLMTSYNFEIEELPDNLKCAKCKLVLKDACQVPCGCRFCRFCIDDMMANGIKYCPTISELCRESSLSHSTIDYAANNSVSKLTVKCVNNECVLKCHLANMEDHLRACSRRSAECPFRELGCTQTDLTVEDIGRHLQHENRGHSEILIGMIAAMNRDIEDNRREISVLKQREEASRKEIEKLNQREEASRKEIEKLNQRDEASRKEIEKLKQREENGKREIEKLNQRNVDSRKEVENLKLQLDLKEGQTRSIMDQVANVENENKSMKIEMKSMKIEKADLADRMKIFSEKVDREIGSRQNTSQLDSDNVTENFGRKIAPVIGLIGSNKTELSTEMSSVRGDIQSINRVVKSIEDDVSSMKSQVQSLQMIVGLDDAHFDWVIDEDIVNSRWVGKDKASQMFQGAAHPYTYQLRSFNGGTLFGDSLMFWIRIYQGSNDGQLAWPFEGRVVITVADREHRSVCRTISQQCRIDRPPDNGYKRSSDFRFRHSELIGTGLNLIGGVCVSCVIVPGVGR